MKSVSWLHASVPWGCSLQSCHKDLHFWCKHYKLAFTQNSCSAVVPCLMGIELHTGRCVTGLFTGICSHLTILTLVRGVNFQSQNESLMNLHIHVFPSWCIRLKIWSKPLQHSWKQSREVACNNSHGWEWKWVVVFVNFAFAVIERSASWFPIEPGGVRVNIQSGVRTATVSNLKATASFSLN